MNTGKPHEFPRRLPYSAWWPLVMGANWYAASVADFLVGDFAARILEFYARRAQQAGAGFSE